MDPETLERVTDPIAGIEARQKAESKRTQRFISVEFMDCKHILQELNLYIDRELEQEFCGQLEAHLKGCDRCRIVLDTTQRTIQLYRDQTPMELPEGVKDRLPAALRARWNKIRPEHPPSGA